MNSDTAKCDCVACSNHIEFPIEAAGTQINCPHCGATTELLAPAAEETIENQGGVSPEQVLAGFTGPIKRTPVSLFYGLGLILVAGMMALLPALYLALTAGVGYGVYYYGTSASGLLHSMGGGIYVFIVKLMIYFGPLFAGCVMVFFMIKPLFARRPSHAQPLALNPAVEKTLFTYIAKICTLVGAPLPTRIDLDCQLNASAGFRRGGASTLGKPDLALTIGLPLVAAMNAREFAGIVAHEFGHFTQGFGMRLSYFIRCINSWFARVVFERDAWDVAIEQAAMECRDWRIGIIIGCGRLGIWLSRLLLKGLMLTGHGACCFLLRQMEYNADNYQIQVAGSARFESAMLRCQLLGVATALAHKEMRVCWNNDRTLPQDFPNYLMYQESRIPSDKKELITGSAGLARTKLLYSHPSVGDRIRKARQAEEAGVFTLEFPASCLFCNFTVVSQQVTRLHYQDDLGIPLVSAKFRPMTGETATSEKASPSKGAPPVRFRVPIKTKDS